MTHNRTQKRSRGSALIAVMMVIAMLMAVVLGLSYYQANARHTYMSEEAALRFRQGVRYEQRHQALGLTVPSSLLVSATVTNVTPAGTSRTGPLMAAHIFDRNSMPDLKNKDKATDHDVLDFKPTTSDWGLRVFGSNTFGTVMSSVPGYAAYAPKGKITISNLEGWANPAFGDARQTLEAFSGVKAIAAGLKDVTVSNATYAEALTLEGDAKVAIGLGAAYKLKQFPMPAYEATFLTSLTQARDQLRNNALGADKSNSLVSPSTGPAAILDLFFSSGGLESFLSLRNANHFFLPMIPSFSPSPPYLYQFAFSLPYPPDNANYSSAEGVEKQLNDIGKQLETAGKELKTLKEALDKAKADFADDPSEDNQNAVVNAQLAYDAGLAKVNDLTQQMNAVAGPQKATVDAGAASGMKGVPLTRAQDPSGDEGQTGWNYSKAGGLLAELITFLPKFIAGPEDAAKDLALAVCNDDVKLVHFGGKDREFKFLLDDTNMTLDATLTVPRGRCLRLTSPGTITVAGDLWLQRGSTLVLDCNRLLVVPGRGSDPSKYFSPNGKICLEEGATLICSGDLDCLGSSQWGSVMVGGVPGKIHPITSGIFARSVRLGNGVFAGAALDDILEGLGVDNATLKGINDDLMRPLMSTVAPNAAKVLGPFWPRKPYFAKYATTFQIICPPLPPFGIPGPPIPTPIPLPSKNVLVPVERVLAYVYSINLNLNLGDNFYTHSDWWIFGEGVVPMVPQVDPAKVVDTIGSFASTGLKALDPETIIKAFVDAAVTDMITYAVEEVIHAIVEKVAASAIPYAGLVGMAADLLGDIATDQIKRDDAKSTAGQKLTSALTDAVGSAAKSSLNSLASKFSTSLENEFLREYNGLLVYAEESVDIGGNMATGLFVAGKNVNITSKRCVGSVLSRAGDIQCTNLLFYPYFNRASLYVPKPPVEGAWLVRALQLDYDQALASGQAVDVGPPTLPRQVSAQGWMR